MLWTFAPLPLSQGDKARSEQERLDALEAKRQAKLAKGGGKKKNRMAKTGGAAIEAELATATAATAAGGDSDDSDDDGPRSRKDQKKADKKAEHRGQVAARNEQREAIKEREAELEAKRKAKEQRAEEREQAREERERQEKEAAEKRKQEELDKWASMFSVEETGEEGADADGEDEATLLSRFVEHIKACKVNVLEELGGEFGLKTSDVIQRVRALEAMGHLSGVIDDRGKFICITPDEMKAVAKFVQRKGRVRISTLAQESNKLIDLTPRKAAEDDEAVEEEAA